MEGSSIKKILAVNSNEKNIEVLSEVLGKEGYIVDGLTSIENPDLNSLTASNYSLALVDITGFDKRIWNFCEQLREKDISFVVISPKKTISIQQQSIDSGAKYVMTKPLVIKELLLLIQSMSKDNCN